MGEHTRVCPLDQCKLKNKATPSSLRLGWDKIKGSSLSSSFHELSSSWWFVPWVCFDSLVTGEETEALEEDGREGSLESASRGGGEW